MALSLKPYLWTHMPFSPLKVSKNSSTYLNVKSDAFDDFCNDSLHWTAALTLTNMFSLWNIISLPKKENFDVNSSIFLSRVDNSSSRSEDNSGHSHSSQVLVRWLSLHNVSLNRVHNFFNVLQCRIHFFFKIT